MTEPLTPPDCDLSDFASMFFDVRRLLTSETWIEAAEKPRLGHVLMNLWMESWHQRPAASVPNNDAVLARLAMCDLKTWKRLRDDALKGWVLCDDGRFYHPTVAEKALEAWERKTSYRDRTAAARAAKQAKNAAPTAPVTDSMTNPVTESVTGLSTTLKGRGRGTKEEEETKAKAFAPQAPQTDLDALAWSEGKRLLVERGGMTESKAGGFFRKLLADHKVEARDMLGPIADGFGKGTMDPQSWLVGAAKSRSRKPNPVHTPDLGYC